MLDPLTIMGLLAIASTATSAGGLYRSARAGVELVQLALPPIGQALNRAFGDNGATPDDMTELLNKLD